MELRGLEPLTFLAASQTLSQLSYSPWAERSFIARQCGGRMKLAFFQFSAIGSALFQIETSSRSPIRLRSQVPP